MSEELEKREDEASSLHSAATSAVQEQQRAADSKIALLAKAVKHAARWAPWLTTLCFACACHLSSEAAVAGAVWTQWLMR